MLKPEQRSYLRLVRPRLLTEAWQVQTHLKAENPHSQMIAISQLHLRTAASICRSILTHGLSSKRELAVGATLER